MLFSPQRRGGRKGSWWVVCGVVLCASFAVACGDGEPIERQLDLADAQQQLEADYTAWLDGSWRVTYHVRIDGDNQDDEQTVTWFKQDRAQQRFDVEGTQFGEAFDVVQVFIPGDNRTTILCSPEIPVDPADEEGRGEKGACCDGGFGCGDIGGNLVYGAGFPLDFPLASMDEDVDFSDVEILEFSEQKIAGAKARCYTLRSEASEFITEEERITKACYGEGGVELFRDEYESAHLRVEAVSVELGVADSDFDLPYMLWHGE